MGYRRATLKEAKAEALRYLNMLRQDGVSIRAAYLFGSFTEGKQRSNSDIDLLVSVRGFKNWLEVGGYLHRKLFGFKSRIPLDVIGHCKPKLNSGIPLENEVLHKGIRLV